MQLHTVLKYLATASFVIGGLAMTNSAIASDDNISNRFIISLGSYVVAKADTTIALSERNVGLGVAFDPNDALGANLEQTVFRLDGGYRINTEDSINFSWYKITNSGSKELDGDIEWINDEGEEIIIEAGSKMSSKLGYEIFKINYAWSFYNSGKVKLFTSAGLHATRFLIDVEIVNTVSGSPNSTSTRDIKSTIPLPAFGLGIIYNISPQWHWYMQAELFAMKYNDWTGSYSDLIIGIEYKPYQHFGIGVGVGANNLNVVEKTDDYKFSYDNQINGINVHLSTRF